MTKTKTPNKTKTETPRTCPQTENEIKAFEGKVTAHSPDNALLPDNTPDSSQPDPNEIYLTAGQVKKRYGGITEMSLWRWLTKKSGFPQPVYICERRYWKLSELVAYERRCVTEHRVRDNHISRQKRLSREEILEKTATRRAAVSS